VDASAVSRKREEEATVRLNGMKKKRKQHGLNTAPILFIQWLRPGDEMEAEDVWAKFHDEVEIRFANVTSREEAIASIKRWLHRNPNAQFLYFSTHGDADGLGTSTADGIDWPELWDLLAKALKRKTRPISLWLGACCSAYAAHAWSPVKGRAPVEYIVGFPIPVGPDELGKVLKRLMKMTRLDPVTYVDEEIPKLRRSIKSTSVLMHYKAKTKDGTTKYVNRDTFRKQVGLTLRRYLESKGRKRR
jgi:hypothetical protein